jgi:hypothetical protein
LLELWPAAAQSISTFVDQGHAYFMNLADNRKLMPSIIVRPKLEQKAFAL